MGCDIHCYVEYRTKPPHDGVKQWSSFGGNINPGRHYPMFAALAGVRNYDEVTPISEPRGVPEDAGYSARSDNMCYICESEIEGSVTAERAAEYVEKYGCSYINGHDGKPAFVTDPDWHSRSWLSSDEWEAAINMVGSSEWGSFQEYRAILAALRSFEAHGYDARVVFWFDN